MITEEDVDDFLAHYGVLGMRWGQRRESKYFAPTTKEERQKIRRSASAKKGQKVIAKAGASVAVGLGAGHIAQRMARNYYSQPVAAIIGTVTAHVGATFTAHALDLNGERERRRRRDNRNRP